MTKSLDSILVQNIPLQEDNLFYSTTYTGYIDLLDRHTHKPKTTSHYYCIGQSIIWSVYLTVS